MLSDKYWQAHRQELARLLKRAPFGLITDIDGTISPIASTPQQAQVTPGAREALRALAKRLALVAALSGRGAADANRMLNLPGVEIVGSHGLERWRDGQAALVERAGLYLDAIHAALKEANPLLLSHGITLEQKGITASLHYRNAPEREAVRDAVYPQLAAIAARHGLELFEGRYIIELHPPLEVNKGTALTALAEEYALSGLIFMGDDVTDLTAMRAVRELRSAGRVEGASLGVVSDEAPADVSAEADYTLRDVADVERFLGWLLDNLG